MTAVTPQQQSEDAPVSVTLTTSALPQNIIGRPSPLFPDTLQEFRGIPYATVSGRWKHSVVREKLPIEPFLATKNGPQCPQPPSFATTKFYQSHLDWPNDVGESEFDCLNLFIVRPSPEALAAAGFALGHAKLPVYVNIHGGGLGFGAASDPPWDPSRLVARALEAGTPIMAANMNYRLGIFGFGISSGILESQTDDGELKGGNFGLGDQRNALRWISKNIADFGGDPTKVTIAGQSAGSKSVQLHVLEAKFGGRQPLFRRAIMQSGALGGLGPTPLNEMDENWKKLYDVFHITDKSERETTEYLSGLPASELLAAAMDLQWFTIPPVKDDLTICDGPDGRWSAHFGRVETPSALQVELPSRLEVLIGDCSNEAMLWNQITRLESFEDMKQLLEFLPPSAQDEIFGVYGLAADTPIRDLHTGLSELATDCHFGINVDAAQQEFLSSAPEQNRSRDDGPALPTVAQRFKIKFGNPFPGPLQGIAQHCVDLIYIYDCFHDHLRSMDSSETLSSSRPNGWASNASLVSTIQNQWIRFIVDDSLEIQEDELLLFETNRQLYAQQLGKSPYWAKIQGRLEVLRKYRTFIRQIMKKLQSI